MRSALLVLTVVLCARGLCLAQNTYPPVAEMMKRFDKNLDGVLTDGEVAKSRYARQFVRWDTDKNGKVTDQEIITFRRRFGIAADGSLLPSRQPKFSIPDAASLPRVDRKRPPTRQVAQQSAYVLRTELHDVLGDSYFILTDHTKPAFLDSLKRLAKFRDATILETEDLASLHEKPAAFERLRQQLRDGNAKFVAIAPRMESFRENTVLALWELLSTIDADPQIDVFPGFLLASSETAFARLIDQSIAFQSLALKEVKPLAISQVPRASETRSLQKAGILRKQFAKSGVETPVVAIYGQDTPNATRLSGDRVWNLQAPAGRKFVRQFPVAVTRALEEATLIIMHGHGVPGMSCSVDVEGLPKDLSGKILLSGSCFSAAPAKSDLPKMRQAPGGYQVQPRDAFVIRAVDHGAVAAFGHQRLSSGFPHLYPVLEAWMKGETVGRAYQQLLNGLIDLQNTREGEFVISDEQKRQSRHPQNRLLYVVIGDPALQPLERFKQ